MDITQTFELQNGFFFWRRDYFTYVFYIKKNKNRNKVENPYYSLGLLQQYMVISGAVHHGLLQQYMVVSSAVHHGLLQQYMVISGTVHHDLSVVDGDLLIYDGELKSNDRRGNFTFGRENFKV